MVTNLTPKHLFVTESEVRTIPTPEWTDSWHPVSHELCIDTLTTALKTVGIENTRRDYCLDSSRNKVFASWAILGTDDNVTASIVWRNSLDKSFAFGIAAGTHTFICSNLAFNGDFIEFRRHTAGMNEDELERVVSDGVAEILPLTERFLKWHQALHEIKIAPNRLKMLAYDAIIEDVLPQNQVTQFNNLVFKDEARYCNNELYDFHGAMTEIYHDLKMTGGFQNRQKALFGFIQNRYEKQLPELNN